MNSKVDNNCVRHIQFQNNLHNICIFIRLRNKSPNKFQMDEK